MNGYLVKINYQIICGEGHHTPQFDEQLRLVFAEHQQEAYAKAEEIGIKEADCFLNSKQKMVEWRFINVSEIYDITSFPDGAEIFSSIREVTHAESFISLLGAKAELLNGTIKMPEFS